MFENMENDMKKIYNKIIDQKYGLYAFIGIALMNPSVSFAEAVKTSAGFAGLAENLTNQMKSAATIALAGFALLGLFFVGTGLLRLKAAVDSQGQQVKYGEGIWRIGLGAAMISVSAIINISNTTLLGASGSPNTSLWGG